MRAVSPAPLPDVAAVERRIVAEEGPFHVSGRYFADPRDADCQRRLAAEQEVRDTERRAQWLARQLAGVTVTSGQQLVRLALGLVARAKGQRLTPEQVAQVVAAARVLWHAAHDHQQNDAQPRAADGRAA